MEMPGRRRHGNGHVEHSSQIYFPSWIYDKFDRGEELEIGDHATEEEKSISRRLILIALWCTQMTPEDRPSMREVLEMLEGDLSGLKLPHRLLFYPPDSPISMQGSSNISSPYSNQITHYREDKKLLKSKKKEKSKAPCYATRRKTKDDKKIVLIPCNLNSYSIQLLIDASLRAAALREKKNSAVLSSSELEIGDHATEEEKSISRRLILIALWCTQMTPENRPSMQEILEMLEGDLSGLKLPHRPLFYPPDSPISMQG
ncbi:unnamed protein product, partial [Coffea canephora]